MQTAVINTESTINLSNHSHDTMNRPSPILHIPQFNFDQVAHRRPHTVLCYEEPGDVLCLEEVDTVPEAGCVEVSSVSANEPDAPSASVVLADLMNSPALLALPTSAPERKGSDESDSEFGDLPELDPGSPEIAPFLLSAARQRATDDAVSLKEAGRDFNDLPAEVALLVASIADTEKTLRQIVDGITPEVFLLRA